MQIEANFRLFIAVARQEISFHRERLGIALAIARNELQPRIAGCFARSLCRLQSTCVAVAQYEETCRNHAEPGQFDDAVLHMGPHALQLTAYFVLRQMLGGSHAEMHQQQRAAWAEVEQRMARNVEAVDRPTSLICCIQAEESRIDKRVQSYPTIKRRISDRTHTALRCPYRQETGICHRHKLECAFHNTKETSRCAEERR